LELKLNEKLLLLNTAEPAGFEKIEEISPPKEEKAPLIALNLAVPEVLLSVYSKAS
jgi:hypothetical protein